MKRIVLHLDAQAPRWLQVLAGRGSRLPAGLSIALLALGAAAAADAVWDTIQLRARLAEAREATAAQARAVRPSTATPAAARAVLDGRKASAEVVRALNVPWAAIFDALEASAPDDVALVSIEPDPRRGAVRLQAEARNLQSLLAYTRALQGSSAFAEVLLVRHETLDQDPQKPVRLSVDVRLRSNTEGAR